ncbi:MAG: ribonucleotide reductase N-terminal alpha domain-containing protein, partial [Halofilum sp. (in: g-proteobacteria)]
MNSHLQNRDPFEDPLARRIWDSRYRWRHGPGTPENDIDETWTRVADTLAGVEPDRDPDLRERFLGILRDFRFLPGGRILAGAGTNRRVTLFNCFVMGRIEDSMDGIFDALRE